MTSLIHEVPEEMLMSTASASQVGKPEYWLELVLQDRWTSSKRTSTKVQLLEPQATWARTRRWSGCNASVGELRQAQAVILKAVCLARLVLRMVVVKVQELASVTQHIIATPFPSRSLIRLMHMNCHRNKSPTSSSKLISKSSTPPFPFLGRQRSPINTIHFQTARASTLATTGEQSSI